MKLVRLSATLIAILLFVGCKQPPLVVTPTKPATHTPTLTRLVTPTNPSTPTSTLLLTATLPPSPLQSNSTPTDPPPPTDGYFLFFWTVDPSCNYSSAVKHQPNYGLYKAIRQAEGWQVTLLKDGFYNPRVALSPNQKYLAVDTQVVGHDEDYLLCGNDPRPSVREFQFYDIQANNFQTISELKVSTFDWRTDSQYLVTQDENFALLQVNVSTLEIEKLVILPGLSPQIKVSTNNVLAILVVDEKNIHHLYILDNDDDQPRLVFSVKPPPDEPSNAKIAWSPDGTWLMINSTDVSDTIFLISADTSEKITITDQRRAVFNSWSKTGEKIAFSVNREDLYIWSRDTNTYKKMLDIPYIPHHQWANNSNRMTINIPNEDNFLLDVDSGNLQSIKFNKLGVPPIYGWLPNDDWIVLDASQQSPEGFAGLHIMTPNGLYSEPIFRGRVIHPIWIESE